MDKVTPAPIPEVIDVASGSNATSQVSLMALLANTVEKPEKFSGEESFRDFRMWRYKMLFYLTALGLKRYVKEEPPKIGENVDAHAIKNWEHNDCMCKNHILSCLSDDLYLGYSNAKTAKELWDLLTQRYKAEEACEKKFVVGKILDYKMVDSRSMITQFNELQALFNDCNHWGMEVSEAFQVGTIIHLLPSSWSEFKLKMKLKRKEITLVELFRRIRSEVQYRELFGEANVMEQEKNSKVNKAKKPLGPTGGIVKKKFNGQCFNCNKMGHKSSECKLPKKVEADALKEEIDRLQLKYSLNQALSTTAYE